MSNPARRVIGWPRAVLGVAAMLLCPPAVVLAQTADRLEVYGYFDLEIESKESGGERRLSFDQHHFNVITVYRPEERWRIFAEVEWEHGPRRAATESAGLIELERAFVEYTHSPQLQIRLGKYLPPFGIYNLRHDATPTYLMSFLPASVYGSHENTVGGSQRLYAKFGTGVEVLGTVAAGAWHADYSVYLSNGRGVTPAEADDNQDKGVGGRLLVRLPADRVRAGLSFYTDRNGLAAHTRQHAVAFDLAFERQGALIEFEALVPRLERVDDARVPNGTFRTGRGAYLQGSYRIREVITPFVRWERYDGDTGATGDSERTGVVGINLMVNPSVYLKGELQIRDFANPERKSDTLFVSSIAVAF